jgi:DNA-binding FadR family transcriptional regulator
MAASGTAAMDATHVVSRSSAADQVAGDLREQIVTGAIARGAKLPSEKQLCASYRVSAITVRAALRSLAATNLIEVRHGVGSFVTIATDELLGTALRSVIQLDRITAPETLAVLGSLNGFAAELCATNATDAEIAALDTHLDEVERATSIPQTTDALARFLDALAAASGNALLQSLCRFLGGLQISLARDLANDSFSEWLVLTNHLRPLRREIVHRIRERDAKGARRAAIAYHEATSRMISSLPPRAKDNA